VFEEFGPGGIVGGGVVGGGVVGGGVTVGGEVVVVELPLSHEQSWLGGVVGGDTGGETGGDTGGETGGETGGDTGVVQSSSWVGVAGTMMAGGGAMAGGVVVQGPFGVVGGEVGGEVGVVQLSPPVLVEGAGGRMTLGSEIGVVLVGVPVLVEGGQVGVLGVVGGDTGGETGGEVGVQVPPVLVEGVGGVVGGGVTVGGEVVVVEPPLSQEPVLVDGGQVGVVGGGVAGGEAGGDWQGVEGVVWLVTTMSMTIISTLAPSTVVEVQDWPPPLSRAANSLVISGRMADSELLKPLGIQRSSRDSRTRLGRVLGLAGAGRRPRRRNRKKESNMNREPSTGCCERQADPWDWCSPAGRRAVLGGAGSTVQAALSCTAD
jgi:hypothetical protein